MAPKASAGTVSSITLAIANISSVLLSMLSGGPAPGNITDVYCHQPYCAGQYAGNGGSKTWPQAGYTDTVPRTVIE